MVAAGYDHLADRYLATKRPLDARGLALLERLVAGLPDGAPVLDLGCGAGLPVTQWLARRFAVTGVDVSARQLALARRHAPGATFIQADMTALDLPAASVDAIVAFYSIIHVPRAEHAPLLARLRRWLRPGGRFLATWPLTAWEGREEDWLGGGAAMWWSHFGRDENLALLRQANFTIEAAEERQEGDERWLWALAAAEDLG